MSIVSVILIFICICVDNMVCANMSAMKLDPEQKSVFSIKVALFFSAFNALFFGLGYLIREAFFGDWVYLVRSWVAFAFLLLLGIKFMLESIEKSPSFNTSDLNDINKLLKVSVLMALNAFLVGYAVATLDTSCFPQLVFLFIITFAMTLLGFHLGNQNSKTIASKKIELIAGIILIIMSVCLIAL